MSLFRRARTVAVALALLVIAAGMAAPSPAAAAPAAAADPITVEDLLDLLTYRVNTTVKRSGTPFSKSTDAVVAVPALVDVDNAVIPIPDLLVTVVALPPSLIGVTVQRLSGGSLPLKAELQFDLPGASSPAVTYGFDALTSSAPTTFITLLNVSRGAAGNTTIDANVTSLVASSPFALVGSVFNRGAAGPVDPMNARVEFAPAPTALGVHVESSPLTGQTKAQLNSTAATTATVDVNDQKSGRSRTFHSVINRLPQSASVELTNTSPGDTTLHYQASSPISSITASLTDTDALDKSVVDATATNVPAIFTVDLGKDEAHYSASGRLGGITATATTTNADVVTQQTTVAITDVPTQIDFVRDSATHVAMTANDRVGSIEGGFATNRAVELLPDAGHYINAVTQADGATSLAAQVVGLRSFDVALGDPLAVTATLDSAALHARNVDPARTIDVTTSAVPSTVAVSVSPVAGVAEYHASAPIDQIKAIIDTTQPFVDKAKHGEVTINTVPADLRFDFGKRQPEPQITTRAICVPDQSTDCPEPEPPIDPGDDPLPPPPAPAPSQDSDQLFVFDANGASIGSIDVLLTSGGLPAKPLAADEDGVVLDQTATTFKLQGRISGLKGVSARLKVIDQSDEPIINRITRRNTFAAHLDPKVVQTRKARLELNSFDTHASATVDRLPTDINNLEVVDTIRLASLGVRQETLQAVEYDASAAIGRIDVNLDLPALPNPLTATILQAPKNFTLCKASDGSCNDEPGDNRRRDSGSFLFDADAPVTLSAFLCLAPATGTCTDAAQATSALKLQNVSLQHIAYELNMGTLANDGSSPRNPFSILFDTDGHPVSGDIEFFIDDKADIDLTFPGDSFAGNASRSFGVDIQNMPALNTFFWQLTVARVGALSVSIDPDGRFDCNTNTRWTLVIPFGIPDQDLTPLVCGT